MLGTDRNGVEGGKKNSNLYHHNRTTGMPFLPERRGKKTAKPLKRNMKAKKAFYYGVIKPQS